VWKVTVKGLLAHKFRLALTALAIVLGVTFVSGTFVLTDTLQQTFNNLFSTIYQHVDFQVRGSAALSSSTPGGAAQRNPIPQSVADSVRRVPGVAAAEGTVTSFAQFVAPDGKAISNGGAPTIGISFDPNPELSSLRLVGGTAPTRPDQVAMDQSTARKYHFRAGQRVRVELPGPTQTFVISGIVRFGTAGNLAGATIAAFDLPTAQQLFGLSGRYDTVNVLAAPGADKAKLQRAIAAVLPRGVEVVTGKTVADEASNEVSRALSFFSTALLVFAFIALFVGAFTIFNTFSIILGQRTRELALLRIVGASRGQLFRSVLGEAFIVGLVAALVGLALGALTALGLEALLSGFGISLPASGLVFAPRTAVAGLLVGVGVTVISAVSPARRAVRIPPVAALADYQGTPAESSRSRLVGGTIVLAAGVAVLGFGLEAPKIQAVGLGAAAAFVGIGMLAPLVARPMASVIGRPMQRLFGMAGRLGRANSMRSPRRTAQTASALIVGLALVATMAVFGASLSRSVTGAVDQAVSADYIVAPSSNGPSGFSSAVPVAAASVPGVVATSTVYSGAFELRRDLESLTAVSVDHLADTVTLRTVRGTAAPALAAGQLLVDSNVATSKHLDVGSVVPVRFARTGRSTMRVGGIYKPNALVGSYVVGDGFFLAHFDNPLPQAVLLRMHGGASAASTRAIQRGLAAFPGLKIQTRSQFEKSQESQVNQLLGLVYALLALAILIAMIGIVNTLMLSVFERTHEIGLLRAVGMRRRQVRTMIRTESVILALFGAVIGVLVGIALGVAFSKALAAQGITDIVVPVGTLVAFLVIAGVLGLVASTWPARRAARLDVLSAIAAE